MNQLVTQPSWTVYSVMEANYAGTSFATMDKWKSGDFKYGSDIVNIFADKTQQGSLGAVGL